MTGRYFFAIHPLCSLLSVCVAGSPNWWYDRNGREREEVLDEGSGGSTSLTPIWGSFLDRLFVDPLTGRPRLFPLELVLAGERSNFYCAQLWEQ